MPNSRIGKYQIEINIGGYSSPTRTHDFRMWVRPTVDPIVGTDPTLVDLQLRGGGNNNLQAVANQVWSFARLGMHNTAVATNYSLWRFATENARDFVTAGSLSVTNGAGGGSFQAAQQLVLTFRHASGGIGKLVFLESVTGGDTQAALVANSLGAWYQRVAAYVMSADSPMIALDNSFPTTPLRQSFGQNEKLWRLLYRNGT